MRINSSGNVGIGVSPSSKLHIKGSSNQEVRIQSTGGGVPQIGFILDGVGSQYIYGNFGSTQNIAFEVGGSERMRIDSAGDLKFNSGFGSVGTAYGCRAWVNFNGTGTPAIRGSGNISSITDVGTGQYTVNFTNNMPDANYSPVFGSRINETINGSLQGTTGVSSFPVQVRSATSTGSLQDVDYICIAVFR